MKINEVINVLENIAPVSLQENYDNAGLIIGNREDDCTGIIASLDVTEAIIEEAIQKKCNLIVAHHPIIFKGLKKITGKNYVERTVITAIKNNIAIYAIHTNLDNIIGGVNKKLAEKLNLQNCKVLLPKEGTLKKLVTFSPIKNADEVRNALFKAGGGTIGQYDECSFNIEGKGTFKAGEDTSPYIGKIGERHSEQEARIEIIFPGFLQNQIIQSLKKVHPYEEVAYDIYLLENQREDVGSGLIGSLPEAMTEIELLNLLKKSFGLSVIKHTPILNNKISKVALCGGAGIFLLPQAIAASAEVYITSDIKYHEFFDADNKILLADIGHYESEQFTIELIAEILQQKFPNFAVQKTEITTNPVHYYI
ncbi:MAG: Nif3-like dinuclear metal center hexameric protein [Bacteroidota bacterium]|nr:Nif3-like dinuclear metal center hexameric protein [Bacteroidota bacterium]